MKIDGSQLDGPPRFAMAAFRNSSCRRCLAAAAFRATGLGASLSASEGQWPPQNSPRSRRTGNVFAEEPSGRSRSDSAQRQVPSGGCLRHPDPDLSEVAEFQGVDMGVAQIASGSDREHYRGSKLKSVGLRPLGPEEKLARSRRL